LKTRKGGLGKNLGKRPWAWKKLPKGHHRQNLHGKEKRKEKKKNNDYNKKR